MRRCELGVAGDALLAEAGELRDAERGVAQRPDRAGLHAAIVHRPFADVDLAEADLDEVARRRRDLLARALGAVELGELLLPVLDVEADDQVGVPQRVLVHAEAERMLVGKVERVVDVPHGRAGRFGKRDDALEAARAPSGIFRQQHGMLGREQLVGDRGDRARVGRHESGRSGGADGRERDIAGERLLLQRRVVAHVDRALRLRGHDRIGARERFRHALDRGRLVVPLHVVADGVALHQRGMRPVDVRAALGFVHRAGGADDEDRHAVEIGVVDRHAGMQQPDQVVQDHRHRLAGRLGVAVRDLHGDLLVLAQHHRRLVAAVVDQRIVQAAKARAGIERDVGEAVALDQVDDDVGLPAAIVLVGALRSSRLFLHRRAPVTPLSVPDEFRRLVRERLGRLSGFP